jgi:hypothetical protein
MGSCSIVDSEKGWKGPWSFSSYLNVEKVTRLEGRKCRWIVEQVFGRVTSRVSSDKAGGHFSRQSAAYQPPWLSLLMRSRRFNKYFRSPHRSIRPSWEKMTPPVLSSWIVILCLSASICMIFYRSVRFSLFFVMLEWFRSLSRHLSLGGWTPSLTLNENLSEPVSAFWSVDESSFWQLAFFSLTAHRLFSSPILTIKWSLYRRARPPPLPRAVCVGSLFFSVCVAYWILNTTWRRTWVRGGWRLTTCPATIHWIFAL